MNKSQDTLPTSTTEPALLTVLLRLAIISSLLWTAWQGWNQATSSGDSIVTMELRE